MAEIILAVILFILSLIVLIKGADYFIDGAENIGIAFGLTSFVIGVVILGFGTSLPEIASSVIAVLEGESTIPPANVIGSNIANVLLVIGLTAIVARKLIVTKDLIDVELPLLAGITIIFFSVSYDGVINQAESVILLLAFVFYFAYTLLTAKGDRAHEEIEEQIKQVKGIFGSIVDLILGIIFVILGAKYLIEATVSLGSSLGVGSDIIALLAIAVGTSLPELAVSLKAATSGKAEIAVGNILGSNVFNLTIVIGLSGLFGTLFLEDKVLTLALPALMFVTVIAVISGISKRIHLWEGLFYILAFLLFISKLFDII